MSRFSARREIRRKLDELAREIAAHVPQDPETVRRVLDLAAEADLDDPEEFLLRCASLGVDPVEIIRYLVWRNSGRIPVHRVHVNVARDQTYWAWFLMICGGLLTVPGAFANDVTDTLVGLSIFGLGLLVLRRARRVE